MALNAFSAPQMTTVDWIRDIIKYEMALPDDRIYIYNQKFDIPTLEGLFVVVEYAGSKIISSRNVQRMEGDQYAEVQQLYTQEHITVQLFSKNLDALRRKEEAVMALYSIYSQQKQDLGGFQIARNAPIEDLSALEASAILYRFDIPVVIFTWYEKILNAAYYDNLQVAVRVNDGQPDMTREFEQPLINPQES